MGDPLLHEAHGEAMEALGGGSGGDGAGKSAELLGTVELLPDGEDGVTELLDLELGVEGLLGLANELAGELDAVLGLLLERAEGVFVVDRGGESGGKV